MANEHSKYCRKEAEIAEICTDLKNIKRIVMGGNGNNEGLAVSVPKLAQNVQLLRISVDGLKKGLNGFLQYQKTMEGQQQGKSIVRKRNRWIIGILITIVLGLGGLLITALT